jgi:hypothetical protein
MMGEGLRQFKETAVMGDLLQEAMNHTYMY